MTPRRVLSVFIDESGDLGELSDHAPYYIFTLVFHDQAKDISISIQNLNERLAYDGFVGHAIHCGPLIRREKDYKHMGKSERQTLFKRIFYFAWKSPIKYKSFIFSKCDYPTHHDLLKRMIQNLIDFINLNISFFAKFDKIILYYDNGQQELNKTLHAAFSAVFHQVDYRTVLPADYRLFQVADLLCTLELVRMKLNNRCMSESEKQFFNRKELNKTFLKGIDSLRFVEC